MSKSNRSAGQSRREARARVLADRAARRAGRASLMRSMHLAFVEDVDLTELVERAAGKAWAATYRTEVAR